MTSPHEMDTGLSWETWRARWPNAAASRFVEAGGVRWHVQVAGRGPALLLLHGSGGATHSWRDILPRLATSFTVIAPDLPAHGFTSAPANDADGAGSSLPGIATALAALLATLGLAPRVAVGHSAGAAIALRMALDGTITADGRGVVVGLNAALAPPPELYALLVAPFAGALATVPIVARAVSGLAAHVGVTARMLDSTGTPLPPEQRALYDALVRAPRHVHGVLTMMARWDLTALARDLPRLAVPATFASAADDPWVPAASTRLAAARIPRASFVALAAPGHLAHEADPAEAVRVVRAAADAAGASEDA